MGETPAERLAKMPNHQCGRCTSEWGGLGSSERCICGPNVPCGHCGQGMTPAVPDPTVEALSEAAMAAIRAYEADCEAERRVDSQRVFGHPGAHIPDAFPTDDGRRAAICAALVPLLAARAVAPDALRVAVEALLASLDKDREFWLAEAERRHDTFTFVQRDVADYRATRDPQVARLRALLEDGAQ